MTMLKRTVLKSLVVLLAAALLASCDPFGLRDVLRAASRSVLSLDPTDVVIPAGATVTFAADGGVPPYAWSVFSGVGSIDVATGEYLAPPSTGAAVVRVTDAGGAFADTGVTIELLVAGLNLSPADITVTVNSAVPFEVFGGTGPTFTFDFVSKASGADADIGATSGYYVAGSIPGTTDVVRVTDSASFTDTATIHVVALDSAVDYTVSSTGGLPLSAVAGATIGGGLTFTLDNIGSGDGASTVSWKVYFSSDGTLSGGDVVVTEGIAGPLAAGGSSPVGLGGTWPTGPVDSGYLIVTASAADDTSPGNNTSTAHAFTLDPRPVNYEVVSVSHSTGTFTGQSVTGSFTVKNIGTVTGAAAFSWFVYASTDPAIDAGDYLLQSGTHAVLSASESLPIGIASTWPTTPDSYYLLVKVSATDDISALNDTGQTPLPVSVTGAPPANIDYEVAAPASPVGTTAGSTFTGTFDVSNVGTVAGTEIWTWTVYRSTDAFLDTLSDPVAAMGSHAALPTTPPSAATTISYSGTWPAVPGPWYLFATVSAIDDVNSGNNASSPGTLVTVSPPSVDYMVWSFFETSTLVAGDAITGTFQVRNEGGDDGARAVGWTLYLSQDANLDPVGDQVVDAGSITAIQKLTTGGAVGFDGVWPVSPAAPWTWQLYLVLDAADEIDPLDNTSLPLTRTTQPPNANYDVLTVSSPVDLVAGYPMSGSFTVTNLGPHDGTQAVPWRAYFSTNTTYEPGIDTLFDSGDIPSPGLVKSDSWGGTYTGTWPMDAAPWHVVVVLYAGDDQNVTNDSGATGALTTVAPNVNYTVSSVSLTGVPPVAGGSLTAEFVVENIGTYDGTRTVYWSAYRSDDANWTIADPAIGSGMTAALPKTGSATIPFTNVWPPALSTKTYYLFVRVFVDDDVSTLNDTSPALMVVVDPQNIDYDVTKLENTGTLVAGGALQGTIEITNIGTVNGSKTVFWNVYRSTDTFFTEGVDDVIDSGSILGGLPSGAPTSRTFTDTWPEDTVSRTYYYIAMITAVDDPYAVNDQEVSSTWFQVDPPTSFPDYQVINPASPSTGTPGAPLGGTRTFQIKNTEVYPGTKPITWRVYASTDDVLDALDTQISTGSIGALAGSDTSTSITYSGTWPAMGSWYRLIVSLTAADDSDPADDRWVSGSIPVLELACTENPVDDNSGVGPWPGTLSNASATGIVMSEGRYVQINGTFDAKSNYDTYKLQLGPTTTRLKIVVTWATGTDAIDFHLWDETGLYGDSLDLNPNIEEVTYTGLTPGGTWYVGVSFIGTVSYTGQPYQMTWYAEPD